MTIQANKLQWWEDKAGFFGLRYLEADDSFEGFVSNNMELTARTSQEVNGVIHLCGLTEGKHVMDCPCGYGRHSLGLAASGLNVTGCDINSEFLELCEKKRIIQNLSNARFVKNDMRHLNFENNFDAVVNMFYSFGFFEDEEENIAVLQNFHRALKPGGKLLIHTHVTVPRFEKGLILEEEVRTLRSGKQLELTRYLDKLTSREEGKWTLVDGDSRHELTDYSVRIYTTSEYETLCSQVGFSRVNFYADWNGLPYYEEADLLIVVAEK